MYQPPMHAAGPYPPHPQQQPLAPVVTQSTSNIVTYAQYQLGVSISQQKRQAFAECKAQVERIAAQCRRKNRKFRDIEFDLENDRQRCLHNLSSPDVFSPVDTRRIQDLVEKPTFYSGGLRAAEVVQGSAGDCYLVAALSGLTAIPKLVEELCVARDEEIGVYGFLFYRDCYWVPVIVDDLVYTRIPRWELLTETEKELYHYDRVVYNKTARSSMDSLYFAKAGKTEDTWVPLVEKAFAKLIGDYASIMSGGTSEALDIILGGASVPILTKDILDTDKFWNEELLNANKDRLFGCWFSGASIQGLAGSLSYSIAKAVECKGKRFVLLRHPWGNAAWNGPWSDGSKEWTPEWLEVMDEIGHDFSVPAQFVMEYKDFLDTWYEVQRTLVFDDSWLMSSQWLHLAEKKDPILPWNYGDLTFSFSLPAACRTVLCLALVYSRYFRDIQGAYVWNMDFIVIKEGETEPLAESSYSVFYTRTACLELDLEAGNYTVLPRLDPRVDKEMDYYKEGVEGGWDKRKLRQVMNQRMKSRSIAASHPRLMVKPLADVLSGDLTKTDKGTLETLKTYGHEVRPGNESITVTTNTTTHTVVSKSSPSPYPPPHLGPSPAPPYGGYPQGYPPYQAYPSYPQQPPGSPRGAAPDPNWAGGHLQTPYSRAQTPDGSQRSHVSSRTARNEGPNQPLPPPPPPQHGPPFTGPPPPPPPQLPPPPDKRRQGPAVGDEYLEDDNGIVLGLKVFTKGISPTAITGRLKEPTTSV
ncbi:hypothetical protein DFP72DRAFT_885180 [Ephemerocybe angulata]|uniref:Calpain catalytic domain-containing protein n=1 Tax=Ephemerocybe angulata TaxID=980116 RepID=A0A8H6I8U0_9AGAR|nr:hypothetical protein DFP72DRAFT_885180 [Tulosesus angulatus]